MIDTLTSLLVPGGRARISPYVQDAQLQVLLGETPDARDRHGSLRAILKRRDRDIQTLANTYNLFAQSQRQFVPATYGAEEFLRLYLAYYFTTNLSKIQLCMLDLVACNKISPEVTVVDIGVGSGTTAVAVLDFLLAWSTTCLLFGQPFPVESLNILCYDSSKLCLQTAQQVVAAFCQSVTRRKESVIGQRAAIDAMERITAWGMSAKWNCYNIANGPVKHPDGSHILLFASNILNELTESGKQALGESITAAHNGSIATIIEPGDQESCTHLNTWRSALLRKDEQLRVLSPCGEHAHKDNEACCQCWNSRRESLHEPMLYRMLRERTNDPRGFDEYMNHLLSWSYTCLERTRLSNPKVRIPSDATNGDELSTRVMGTVIRQRQSSPWQITSPDPDAIHLRGVHEWIKLCPSLFSERGVRQLWAKRTPGFMMPAIPHGGRITLTGGHIETPRQRENARVIKLSPECIIQSLDRTVKSKEYLTDYAEPSKEAIDEIAFRLFGFKSMRPFQHEILGRVLTGHSILGIAATGGGKSECYILPSMLFPGITIVVSPLKSLMQDQYEKRIDERYGLRNLTTYINGDVPFADRQARLKRMELGYYKLIYFTPEQLRQSHVLNSLKRAHTLIGIRYLALDEAHCISQWGHDFRDSYLNLVTRLSAAGIDPIRIALTATASPEVREDLCEELNLKNEPLNSGGDVYIHSSNRAELNLIVKPVHSTQEKTEDIIERLQSFLGQNAYADNPDAAIVFMPHTGTDPDQPDWYMPNTGEAAGRGRFSAGVTNFASFLERSLETRVAIYHGKMDFDKEDRGVEGKNDNRLGDLSGRSRRSEQTEFIEGRRSIMVATKGFGMGIDKPNIRLIVHRTPTSNLEAYAQEAGRAGRDGGISDVVLYYSPDPSEDGTTAVNSDYDIQNYFLSQKYIRLNDVVAMNTFLVTVQREVCGRLYFTSDEIIPFFDDLEAQGMYEWPEFPPRLVKGFETPEHVEILNRGHVYSEKIRYVDRILSALYRIRPGIGPIKRVCYLASVQETGAVIKCRANTPVVLNAQAIVESNAYYGELLRSRKYTPHALVEAIQQCVDEDTVTFARSLDLSISETASLLWDINRSDGRIRYDRWKSDLLDFLFIAAPKYGAAKGMNSCSCWRAYAGAIRRATVSEARRRAQQARARGEERRTNYRGQIAPTDDDWFGPRELAEPKGWEVAPGQAFKDVSLFTKYVEAFMDVHDRRQANDWAAYRLLLTDYVGVNENGSLPTADEQKNCLRAVLLGYLKTGEIVHGNCRSCSRCVPHGEYEPDMGKREKVVERLGTGITDLLDFLEKSHTEIPEASRLDELWNHVEALEAEGRSLRAYVEGWTGRLLTDRARHKTAIWIRIDGMVRSLLPMQPQEACSRALDLIGTASESELAAIWKTIDLFHNAIPDLPEALVVRATACQRMGRHEESSSLWNQLAEMRVAKEMRHKAHSALCELMAPDGPIPDANAFTRHAIEAARTATEYSDMVAFYGRVRETWPWSDIRSEILFHQSTDGQSTLDTRLVTWWVDSQSDITRLGDTPTPGNWADIIENALSYVEEERSGNSHLSAMLAGAIDKWAVAVLRDSPDKFAVRALRLALLANGTIDNPADYALETLAFLESANDEHLAWIADQIESKRLDADHHVTEFVLADLAFRRGGYPVATACWRRYMDDPPPDVPTKMTAYALARLTDIYRPEGPLPDPDGYHKALSARASIAHDWNEASEYYAELVHSWDAARLQQEVQDAARSRDAHWSLELLAMWTATHSRSNESELILSILANLSESARNESAEVIRGILDHIHPLALVKHPVFGIERLKAITMSGRLNSNQPDKAGLRNMDVEYLLCLVASGFINSDKCNSFHLGDIVFGVKDEEFASWMQAEYAASFRQQICQGAKLYFFHEYQPRTVKAMERWLMWFGELINRPEDARRIEDAMSTLLKSVSSMDRTEIERCVSVCEKSEIGTENPDFVVVKTFGEAIATVERGTDIASVQKLESSHLGMIERFIGAYRDDLHADILVSVFGAIHRRIATTWMTPLSRHIEALVNAGRTEEAAAIGTKPGLTIGKDRVTVDVLIARRKGKSRPAPTYDELLNTLAKTYLKTWCFR